MKAILTSVLVLTALALPTLALAQDNPDSTGRTSQPDAPAPHRSGLLLGGKVGGLVPFGGLSPNAGIGPARCHLRNASAGRWQDQL